MRIKWYESGFTILQGIGNVIMGKGLEWEVLQEVE